MPNLIKSHKTRMMLRVSRLTFERFTERISRLYEQGADCLRIEEYVKHWLKWVRTGLTDVFLGGNNRDRQNYNTLCLPLVIAPLESTAYRENLIVDLAGLF